MKLEWGGDIQCVGQSAAQHTEDFRMAAPSTAGGWVQVAAGDEHMCAVSADGQLSCWGGSRVDAVGQHVVQSSEKSWLAVAAGTDFTCGIAQGYMDSTGQAVHVYELQCWGTGMLASGWLVVSQAAAAGGGVAMVDVGQTYACVIVRDSGALACWGDTTAAMQAPAGAYKTLSVAANRGACALRVDDTLVCWGQLWAHRVAGSMVYVYEYDTSTFGTFDAVTVTDEWMCARRADDHTLWCVGLIVPKIFRTYSNVYGGAVREMGASVDTLCVMSPEKTLQCFGSGLLGRRIANELSQLALEQGYTDGVPVAAL